MKHAIYSLLAAALLIGLAGCQSGRLALPFGSCKDCPTTCQQCDNGDPGARGCGLCGGRDPNCPRCAHARAYDPVPPTGVVTYPYYTTRGPRDFLARNPRSIGP